MNRKQKQELASSIIDLVEDTIRREHIEVENLAQNYTVDGEKPNTLLYGVSYYDLEEEIINLFGDLGMKPKELENMRLKISRQVAKAKESITIIEAIITDLQNKVNKEIVREMNK